MKGLRESTAMGFAAITAVLSMGGSAQATECKQINAQIISTPIFGCVDSAIGLCTDGTIDGNQGLNGTTRFVADSAAPGPATAPNAAATISYSGTLHITTAHGELWMRDTGIFDAATGVFSSFDVVDTGHSSTGKYAGASGTVFIGGTTNTSGKFVTTVMTGSLCLP